MKKKKSVKKAAAEGKKICIDKSVEFKLHASEATAVYLAGEFNQWEPRSLPMKKGKDGVWKTEIKLPPGRYEYKVFADECWAEGTCCVVIVKGTPFPNPESVPNPFGTQNSVFWV